MTDVLLVGGGLANALLALRLRQARPELAVLLLERGDTVGGVKTWSFHDTDLEPRQRAWLAPLVERSWGGHSVRFPRRERRLPSGYHSVSSARLHRAVADALGEGLRPGCGAREVSAHGATLDDGTGVRAACVVDGRGLEPPLPFAAGYQKFLGLDVRLAADSGLEEPVLMDAAVEQRDGFRFMYLLPWSPRRLLIEDTRYSDTPHLDLAALRRDCHDYARARGWSVTEVEREEVGVLPIPLDGAAAGLLSRSPPGVPCIGARAGLFHPTTGYSLPDAVRSAEALAELRPLVSGAAEALLRRRSLAAWRERGYFRLLNRLLFRAAAPGERYRVLEHFYRLPAPLIERFYAARLRAWDRVRILSGRPPVPVARAARVLAGAGL